MYDFRLRAIHPELWMGILLILCAGVLFTRGINRVVPVSGNVKGQTILIDAGHGGDDPGKIGINQAKEKDINLSVAKKLQECLEKAGFQVEMTREEDENVKGPEQGDSKSADMRNRCTKIKESNPTLAVSIHQNSYTEEYVAGPQVFYYTTSSEGKEIAQCIQDTLNEELAIERKREIKDNNTYYILKRSTAPVVIVECGFLSNQREAGMLVTEEYQQQVAEAICKGIEKYLSGAKTAVSVTL